MCADFEDMVNGTYYCCHIIALPKWKTAGNMSKINLRNRTETKMNNMKYGWGWEGLMTFTFHSNFFLVCLFVC